MKPNLVSLGRQTLAGALCLAAALASLPAAAQSVASMNSRASKIALNPQPLPPRAALAPVGNSVNPAQQRGIIIVGGRGSAVSLNPQPLPPRLRGR
jgi:hypothetical protein